MLPPAREFAAGTMAIARRERQLIIRIPWAEHNNQRQKGNRMRDASAGFLRGIS
jgi:hypothetical protein